MGVPPPPDLSPASISQKGRGGAGGGAAEGKRRAGHLQAERLPGACQVSAGSPLGEMRWGARQAVSLNQHFGALISAGDVWLCGARPRPLPSHQLLGLYISRPRGWAAWHRGGGGGGSGHSAGGTAVIAHLGPGKSWALQEPRGEGRGVPPRWGGRGSSAGQTDHS